MPAGLGDDYAARPTLLIYRLLATALGALHHPRMGCLVRIRGQVEGFLSIHRTGVRRFVNAADGARGTEQLLELLGGPRIRAAFQDQAAVECGHIKSFDGIVVDALKAGDYFFMDFRILWIVSQYDRIAGISHDFSFRAAGVL